MIKLPRPLRIWFGKCFLYMLGKWGTDEVKNDIVLYNELKLWVETKGRPTTSNPNYHINSN
jgi:uncharacterized protein YfaT (DUF1175 family)